jgi:diguanylate cyclase (GGDEF)-like protein/PAS domain S-box-containing protein
MQGFEVANEQLREIGEEYRAIFEDAPIGMFQISPLGHPLRFNRAMAQIFGYESLDQLLTEFAGKEPPVLIDPSQWEDREDSAEDGAVRCGVEVNVLCPNGDIKCIRLNLRAVRENGQIAKFEGTGEDITDRKKIEVRNQLLAYYDRVTGLPNRTLFHERLEEAIAAAKQSNSEAALFLIRIDRFKIINDSLGALFGDRLLKEIAQRIKMGAGERSIVARVGGAEFAVILPEIQDASHVRTTAANVVARLSDDFTFLGHSLTVLSHMGISTFPQHGVDGETLMKRADVAMRSAREEGSNNHCFFTSEMNSEILERLRMENGLRLALTRSELFLVYQPQVDSRTGALTGLEALLRWQHPQLGLIPPNQFIGLAENTGLIVPIGEWVLRTACAQARKWQDEGFAAVPVAVNVSALQFRQQGFRDLVRRVLNETGLNPKYLELELTESLLLTNADVMFATLQDFKEMGVMLAIDDFGTGYSSLGYLRQFKVNRLKISRSFVQDVSTNPDDAAITTAIINMAKALNLAVLAEGVENEEQLAFLRDQQCFTIQGFYFSRPVKDEQLLQHLRSGYVLPAPVV